MIKYLILDDEPHAREMLRFQMDRIENTLCVAEAGNVEEALSIIESQEINLLFLDIDIAGNDRKGYEVAQLLADKGLNYGVIYTTSFLKDYYEEVISSTGQYLYYNAIQKPIIFEKLEKAIAEFRQVLIAFEAEKEKTIQLFIENLEKEALNEAFIHSYNGITYLIPYHEILCAFVYNRSLTIISIHENIELGNLQLSQFAEKVAKLPYHFLKIGRNHLINPKTIRKIDTNKGIVSLFLNDKSYQVSLESSEIGKMKKELQQG